MYVYMRGWWWIDGWRSLWVTPISVGCSFSGFLRALCCGTAANNTTFALQYLPWLRAFGRWTMDVEVYVQDLERRIIAFLLSGLSYWSGQVEESRRQSTLCQEQQTQPHTHTYTQRQWRKRQHGHLDLSDFKHTPCRSMHLSLVPNAQQDTRANEISSILIH